MKFAMALGGIMMMGCGSAPLHVHEYILDVKAHMLRGPSEEHDVPLSYCLDNICYVYDDADVRKIKKYIVQLETRLRSCK